MQQQQFWVFAWLRILRGWLHHYNYVPCNFDHPDSLCFSFVIAFFICAFCTGRRRGSRKYVELCRTRDGKLQEWL